MKKIIDITLVVPLYNEANRVGKFLQALQSQTFPRCLRITEVRFVSDGSSDDTLKVLESWKIKNQRKLSFKITILSYAVNKGRGYAVRYGMKDLSTDVAVYMDGDLDIPLNNLERVVDKLDRDISVVAGSKKIPSAICTEDRRLSRMIVGYGHSVIAFIILGLWFWDWQGGIKAFRKSFVDQYFHLLTIDKWGFDVEVMYTAVKNGCGVVEVPLTWGAASEDSRVKLVRDIGRAIKDMISIRVKEIVQELGNAKEKLAYSLRSFIL